MKSWRYGLTVWAMLVSTAVMADAVTPERQQQLLHLLKQDCGSCHGMTLKGGLGPSLLPDRMAAIPRENLVNAIAKGRPGTPMPPWEKLLSPADIQWLAEQLQQGVK